MILPIQNSLQCSIVNHVLESVQQAFWADVVENSISFVNKTLEVVENIYLAICVFEFLLVMNGWVKDLHAINQKISLLKFRLK